MFRGTATSQSVENFVTLVIPHSIERTEANFINEHQQQQLQEASRMRNEVLLANERMP